MVVYLVVQNPTAIPSVACSFRSVLGVDENESFHPWMSFVYSFAIAWLAFAAADSSLWILVFLPLLCLFACMFDKKDKKPMWSMLLIIIRPSWLSLGFVSKSSREGNSFTPTRWIFFPPQRKRRKVPQTLESARVAGAFQSKFVDTFVRNYIFSTLRYSFLWEMIGVEFDWLLLHCL